MYPMKDRLFATVFTTHTWLQGTRMIAAVLLRRIVDPSGETADKIDKPTQAGIRKEMLTAIETGTHPQTNRKVIMRRYQQ